MQFSQLLKKPLFILACAILAKATLKHKKPGVANGMKLIKFDIQSVAPGILKAYRSPQTWKTKDFLALFVITGGILLLH